MTDNIKSGAPRGRQCWMDLNNFPLTEIYWTTGALTTAISNSSSKLLDSWKESSDKSSWSTKLHGEGRNENLDLLSLLLSCHVLLEIPLEIEWASWVIQTSNSKTWRRRNNYRPWRNVEQTRTRQPIALVAEGTKWRGTSGILGRKHEELEGQLSDEDWLIGLFSGSSGLESFMGSILGSGDLYAVLLVVS